MATGTDSDEKDLETLGEVTLNFFKAEPPTIQPFTSSKLSWSVTAPKDVTIRLDAAGLNGTPEESAEKVIGVAQPWEGTPFRRAVHLIWRHLRHG